jgi:hypothetical protein
MNPRYAFALKLLAAVFVILLLAAIFPPVTEFMEIAARELRYLWWLVLLVLMALWLIWGFGSRRK